MSGIRVISDMFAVATVTPREAATLLTPDFRADLARRLLLTGNALYDIDVRRGGDLFLTPVSAFEVYGGGFQSDEWLYELDLAKPYMPSRVRRIGAGILHARIGQSSGAPWRGRSPLTEAGLTSGALAAIELSLQHEGKAAVAHLLAMPDGATEPQANALGVDIQSAKGRIVISETVRQGWGQGANAAPSKDLQATRVGPQVPAASITLRESTGRSVLHALGLPDAILYGDGVALREAYRHVAVRVAPALAAIVAAELSAKLDIDVEFDFEQSAGQDLMQRARAVQALAAAGMSLPEALARAGL